MQVTETNEETVMSAPACRLCPAHQMGGQALAGAIQGTLGGILASLAGQPLLATLGRGEGLEFTGPLWAGLAGLLGAVTGFLFGFFRISLAGRKQATLFAALLLSLTGSAVALLHGQPAASWVLALLGLVVGIPVGLFGRFLVPRSVNVCSLPASSVAEQAASLNKSASL